MNRVYAVLLCAVPGFAVVACNGEPPSVATEGVPALACRITSGDAESAAQGVFKAWVEAFRSSALIDELSSLNLAPVSCSATIEEGVFRSAYKLDDGAALSADSDPRIGYASYSLEGVALPRKDALRLLEAMEQDQVGATGCGVNWSDASGGMSPVDELRREAFSGDICNCGGYLETGQVGVTSLGFRSAC